MECILSISETKNSIESIESIELQIKRSVYLHPIKKFVIRKLKV